MRKLKAGVKQGVRAFQISLLCVFVLFVIKFAELLLPIDLSLLGIVPRTIYGLVGVIFSPLLHRDMTHLLANSVPLFILLLLFFWNKRYSPGFSLAFIWILSGLGTWILGRTAIHIGASSIIYGLAMYLIAAGFWMKQWPALLTAVFTLLFYGGIFYGVLPQTGPISWEGHLSGALAGWWVARNNHA